MAGFVLANDPNVFNVVDFGADPNHNVDSAIAFQKAFCAAICVKGGTVYIPAGEYIVKSTIKVYCLEQFGVNVIGASGSGVSGSPVGSTIDYQGPDGTACFAIQGMNYSYWRGFGVNLGWNGTAANQVAIDFQVGQDNVPVLNQGNNVLECIVVNMQGTGGGHIGIRLSQYNANTPGELFTDQGSNISGTTLRQVTINGDYQGAAPSTSIGVQFGGGQVKPNRVIGCAVGGLGCDYLVGSIGTTLTSSVGAGAITLPVNDVTLFKPNGTNTRYVVINLSEICTYTGVEFTTTPPVNNPTTAPTLSTTGGTSNGAAVYVVFTYVYVDLTNHSAGETTGSPESTLTPTTSEQVLVTSPAASGSATGYNVYVGSKSGGPYYLQNTAADGAAKPISITAPSYEIPGTPASSGMQPPPLNTTGGWEGRLTGVAGVANSHGAGETVIEYQPNVGVYGGADDIVWEECGGGNSLRNFYLQTGGGTCFAILGGRWEPLPGIGQRFLQTGFDASALSQSITVKSVQLDAFTPPSDGNGVIWLTQNDNLEWIGGAAWPWGGSYNNVASGGMNGYFLTNNPSGGSYGAVNFRNFIITAGASALPWNISNNWPVNADLLLVDGPGPGLATGRYRQIQFMANQGMLGFFGATLAGQQSITGALSLVTDTNAKTVLTSIIAALTNLGLAANNTT